MNRVKFSDAILIAVVSLRPYFDDFFRYDFIMAYDLKLMMAGKQQNFRHNNQQSPQGRTWSRTCVYRANKLGKKVN